MCVSGRKHVGAGGGGLHIKGKRPKDQTEMLWVQTFKMVSFFSRNKKFIFGIENKIFIYHFNHANNNASSSHLKLCLSLEYSFTVILSIS